jgi:allene oxide cyclase
MARRILVVGGVVLLVLAVAIPAMAGSSNGGRSLVVVEHADTDLVVDLGAPGDSLGDQLVFGNPIFDAADANEVGRDEGVCFRTNPGLAWECTWTTVLATGSITVQGPFYDDGRDSVLAITGGTGRYANSRGQMTLHWRNAGGTQFDFAFQIIG